MHARHEASLAESDGTAPFIREDVDRARLVWLMAEYARTIGAENVFARVSGFTPPAVVAGTIEDHRPDLVCQFPGELPRRWLVEGVTWQSLADPHLPARWSLLNSLATQSDAELHFVMPRWTEEGDIAPAFRRELESAHIRAHVWHV